MAHLAVILYAHVPGLREHRLGRVLEFFGVPFKLVRVADFEGAEPDRPGYGVFCSAEALAGVDGAPALWRLLRGAEAVYCYAPERDDLSEQALRILLPDAASFVRAAPPGAVPVAISPEHREITGVMSGLEVTLTPRTADRLLFASNVPSASAFASLVAIGQAAAFATWRLNDVPVFFCGSTEVVDPNDPVAGNFYDIKSHFLSAVPLVMFIASIFSEVRWRPQELGACLIIDDPLLKERYGWCDFKHLHDLMASRGFTTNIAFIPWNWRRTSHSGSRFFSGDGTGFSVSVHGCDHTAGEFGSTAVGELQGKAALAQSRMRKHQARTGIEYDPVMVFPQGVFSSSCGAVLKRNGFLAAVNTEVAPVDSAASTRVRDVWDVAMMAHGSFPIFTRRYAFHGVENFAFDLLLGKPCFIVAHHEFFRDGGTALVALLDRLSSLNASLRWRSPREVIRRAYRYRAHQSLPPMLQVEMYGSELVLTNSSNSTTTFSIHKREGDPSCVAEIQLNGESLDWASSPDGLTFQCPLPAEAEALVRIGYKGLPDSARTSTSVKYQLGVAARRILSEARDEYVRKIYPQGAEAK